MNITKWNNNKIRLLIGIENIRFWYIFYNIQITSNQVSKSLDIIFINIHKF